MTETASSPDPANIPAKPIVITGGGSAGHVIPALPVVDRLLASGYVVHFIGTRSGLEQGYLAQRKVVFHGIAAGKLRRYRSWQNFSDLFCIAWAVLESLRLLARIRPSVLFSKGGFVSLPPVVAAWLLRIPVVAHESDLTLGLANRLSLPFIKTLCTSFSDTHFAGFKGRHVVTGTPVRNELLRGDATAARRQFAIGDAQRVLLVTGGSLGAEGLNQIIRDNIAALTRDFFVVHVCGAGKTVELEQPGYAQLEFVAGGWGDLLAAADVVISRAGANALFEWVALSKPNLLVPLPLAGSRGDQLANAAYAQGQGWSEVVAENEITGPRLLAALHKLVHDASVYREAMAKLEAADAADRLLDELQRLHSANPFLS